MTENHDYNTPAEGTTDWHIPLNENFEKIDNDVEIRDTDSNRDSYQPKEGAKYFSTDTGDVYIGNGSSWNAISAGTSDDNPRFNSVNANETYVNAQLSDVIVYQDDGTTRAVGNDGVVESGTNPSAVIETAIQNGRYIEITGDFGLSEEITVTQDNRVIDASAATFTATGDHKLWHFNRADFNRIKTGILDLSDSGRVALDLHSARGNKVETKLKGIPGGTFEEDDGNTNGTYDRCGIRLKGRAGGELKGSYWNNLHVTNPYGLGGNTGGIGVQFTTTDGADRYHGGNANVLHAAKVTDYDVGIDMDVGTGNTFFNIEVTGNRIGYRQKSTKYSSQNDFFGKGWFEHNTTGIDLQGGYVELHGFGSFAGTDTWVTNWDNFVWHDYYRGEYHLANSQLVRHKEGSTGSNPASDSPDGWLEIKTGNGNTRYVPYYS